MYKKDVALKEKISSEQTLIVQNIAVDCTGSDLYCMVSGEYLDICDYIEIKYNTLEEANRAAEFFGPRAKVAEFRWWQVVQLGFSREHEYIMYALKEYLAQNEIVSKAEIQDILFPKPNFPTKYFSSSTVSPVINYDRNYKFFKKFTGDEALVNYAIIDCSIPELENVLFDIFDDLSCKGFITEKDQRELNDAYINAKKAHHAAEQFRKGSGLPYIHHPLAVTIYSWYLAHKMNYAQINIKNLLLAAIYHDTVEDTELFGKKEAGQKISEIAALHGEECAELVFYLSKPDFTIYPIFNRLKQNYTRDYFLHYFFPHMSMETRYIKVSDRTMNQTDLKYSKKEFIIKTLKETEDFFNIVLSFMPQEIVNNFWLHVAEVKQRYRIDL